MLTVGVVSHMVDVQSVAERKDGVMRETGQADAVRWAAMITRRSDVLYLDTETTGLGETDEIVDIAVIDNDGRVLLDTLVKPRRPIPAGATAIHRIADHDVVGAPSWPEVYPVLLDALSGHHHVVVFNADFDRRLIQQSCAAHRLAPPVTRWHCAMKQYAAFVGDRTPGSPTTAGTRWTMRCDASGWSWSPITGHWPTPAPAGPWFAPWQEH